MTHKQYLNGLAGLRFFINSFNSFIERVTLCSALIPRPHNAKGTKGTTGDLGLRFFTGIAEAFLKMLAHVGVHTGSASCEALGTGAF